MGSLVLLANHLGAWPLCSLLCNPSLDLSMEGCLAPPLLVLLFLAREARAGVNKPMKEWLCNYCAMGPQETPDDCGTPRALPGLSLAQSPCISWCSATLLLVFPVLKV